MTRAWQFLESPVTFKHVFGIGFFLGFLAALGFISPFDRLSSVEKTVGEIKTTMVTKEDLQKALEGVQTRTVKEVAQR